MSPSHTESRSEVLLIGGPEPTRVATFEEILTTVFGAATVRADNFEQLPSLAGENRNWCLILVVATSPLSVRSLTRLSQHLRLLGERGFAPPVCFIGPDQRQDMIGIQSPLYYLPIELHAKMSAEERQQIIARLNRFILGCSQSSTRSPMPVEVPNYSPNKSRNHYEDPIDQEITARLAAIKRLNESISADRLQIEWLKAEKQVKLEALERELPEDSLQPVADDWRGHLKQLSILGFILGFKRRDRIKKWKQRIGDAGNIKQQVREANSLRPVVEDWRRQLEQHAASLSARAQEESERRNVPVARDSEPFTIQSEHYTAIVLLLGAWVTMALDVGLSAILATSWINLPWGWAFVVGAVVAGILSLMCKAGILTVAYDAEKPRPTRRRLQWSAIVSFIASFTCIAVILAARNPSESWIEYFMTLTGMSLGALGVLMPILAGALMALAHDLNWSYHYEQKYRQVKQASAEVVGFIEWAGHLPHKIAK